MRSLGFLAVAVLAILPSPARAEFCGSIGFDAQVVSPPDAVVPGDGGLVVAAMPGGNGSEERDEADQPGWRFVAGNATTTPRRKTLAPGLVVYRAGQDGAVQLVDQLEKIRGSAFVTRRPRPRLAAPVVVWTARSTERVDIRLELASLPPADALAIVIAGKDGKARSWSMLQRDTTLQKAYAQIGCQMQSPGTVLSAVGDEVTFFFVDAYGRTSLSSKPMTLAGKSPREGLIK